MQQAELGPLDLRISVRETEIEVEVYFSFVEWNEAESRAKRGSLEADTFDALDDDEATWIEEAEYEDVLSAVFSLGALCDAVFPKCEGANRDAIDRSFGRFMTEESEQWNELPGKLDPEYFWLALSPTTIAEIHTAIQEIDFAELKKQYEITSSESDQLAAYDVAYSPDDFIGHLKAWGSLFEVANASSKGLFVSVG